MLSHTELIIRIAVGAFLGGIIGLERDLHGRHAGLRTHLIVAMASATFMVISIQFPFMQNFSSHMPYLRADVSHIASAIVSGVGFLASGTILRSGLTVQGLTTAAGLWLVTAIGMCAGAGMYTESVAVTFMGMISLTILRLLENKSDGFIQHDIALTIMDESSSMNKILELLESVGAKVSGVDYKKQMDSQEITCLFELSFPGELGVYKVVELLEKQMGVQKIHVRLRKS